MNLLVPSPVPEAAPKTASQQCAEVLLLSLSGARDRVVQTRATAIRLLWRGPVPPTETLAEMTPADARAMMLLDVCQRLGLAVVEAQAAPVAGRAGALLGAFGASSPVPATHTVEFLDAAGDPVDLAAELAALAAKLAGIESVAIAAQPAA